MSQETDKVGELHDFFYQLIEYTGILKRRLAEKQLTEAKKNRCAELFEVVGRKVGYLGPLITELTGIDKVDVHGKEYDMWLIALRTDYDSLAASALGFCIQVTNRAIGRLEDDIKKGYRDKEGNVLKKPHEIATEPPKAFISHGKKSVALTKLEDFVRSLGVEPLIVKEQPSLDKTVDDKVNYYLGQADFVIILATGDDEIDGKLHPRQNVIHEIGLAQKTHAGKIIYLLEEGTEFPSNISPKVWERFKQRNMIKAFLCILRELRALGILRLEKP